MTSIFSMPNIIFVLYFLLGLLKHRESVLQLMVQITILPICFQMKKVGHLC